MKKDEKSLFPRGGTWSVYEPTKEELPKPKRTELKDDLETSTETPKKTE